MEHHCFTGARIPGQRIHGAAIPEEKTSILLAHFITTSITGGTDLVGLEVHLNIPGSLLGEVLASVPFV